MKKFKFQNRSQKNYHACVQYKDETHRRQCKISSSKKIYLYRNFAAAGILLKRQGLRPITHTLPPLREREATVYKAWSKIPTWLTVSPVYNSYKHLPQQVPLQANNFRWRHLLWYLTMKQVTRISWETEWVGGEGPWLMSSVLSTCS